MPLLIPLRSIRNDVPYVDAFPTTYNICHEQLTEARPPEASGTAKQSGHAAFRYPCSDAQNDASALKLRAMMSPEP
ncbi:hypothetical protein A8C56_06910 [Niabella ginsenosidivorans]|uniref:Uncharacterized protein n=1 Tax=Niabella ginsenosidivorans TaxID=1176587 RepID=A0A1A9HZP9_9BACT|nr:hypothetical protein [Niabella ginsenosidivorans]ANH80743.1 hypothetical protein A8C56_06910 [Niabella ginsenosidivorans]